MKICFVIPVYNERHSLEALVEGIEQNAAGLEYRILFVDDGSTDGSNETIRALQQRFPSVDLLVFRRNWGKTHALATAFARTDAEVFVTLDADLQDDPNEIPRLLAKLDEGYDLVCGWKAKRLDPWHKTIPSRIYNGLVRRLFGIKLHDINTGLKAIRASLARRLPLQGDMHRMMVVNAVHMGYRVAEIPVQHHRRMHGHSKYGINRFTRGALDVYTTMFLTRHGDAPGHYFGKTGALLGGMGLLLVALALALMGAGILYLAKMPLAMQLSAMVVALLIFMIGFVLLSTGVLYAGLGLLGELIVQRLPREGIEEFIAEDTRKSREANASREKEEQSAPTA